MLTQITNIELGALDDKPTTQRTNFPFNSFFELDGEVYGCSGEMLATLGGDTDDGTQISAYFEPATTNFGTNDPKRMPYFYATLEADGDLKLTATPNKLSGGAVTYDISPDIETVHTLKKKLGEGVLATFWGFKLENVDGSDFSVYSMEVIPSLINHRFNRH